MWIEQSRNKYRACAYYTDPLTGVRHRVGVTIEKNTPQQRNKAAKRLDEIIARKLSAAPDVMRLSKLVQLYEEDQKTTLKASTCERNKRTCDMFLKILGKDCDVNKLTAGIVKERFLNYRKQKASKTKNKELREKIEKNNTLINEYITRFKALMRWAYRNDFVRDIAYIDKLTKLKDQTKREKVADKFLESDECAALLDAMTHQTWRDMTELMLLSGLRVGECRALTEDDLDFANREIIVNKTYDNINNIVTSTKTLASTRRVYMQDDLFALCRAVVARNRRNRRLLYLNATPLFFSPDGRVAAYDAYRKYLRETSEKTIGRSITPHALRHTHASLLAEQGVPLEQITRRLGHDDSRITREIYVHVTEKKRKTENERLKKIALF